MSAALPAEDPFGLPPVGSNQPDDKSQAIRDDLAEQYGDLIRRRDELLDAIERVPETIDSDDLAGRVGDFAQKQIAACIKAADTHRIGEKEPFLSGGRTVDGFFAAIIDPLTKGKKIIDIRRKAYLDKKAAAERAARIEAERLARVEAEKAARAAREAEARMANEAQLARALEAEEAAALARAAAEKAAREAAAKPAELSRVRGDFGSVSSLKQFWNFADLDRAALDLDRLRDHLPTSALEQAIRSWINANKDALKAGATLRGVRIYEDTRL